MSPPDGSAGSPPGAEDDRVLREELVERGLELLADHEDDEDARDRVLELLVAWLGGDELTGRPDEAERRLDTAVEAREAFGLELFDRLLARSILALPDGHPRRDVGQARNLLSGVLAKQRIADERGERIRTIAALLEHKLVEPDAGERLLEEGDGILDEEDDASGARAFRVAAEGYCMGRFIALRDGDEPEQAQKWLDRAFLYAGIPEDFDLTTADLGDVASMASHLDAAGDYRGAAACYARIVDEADFSEEAVQFFAVREAEVWLLAGDARRSAERGAAVLPAIEDAHLEAATSEAVEATGDRLSDLVSCLALANATLRRWDDAVRAFDRGGDVRRRQRDAAGAGTVDRASTGIAELATAIGDGDAVLVVVYHFTGTAAIIVGHSQTRRPVAALRLPDLDTKQWMEVFGSQGGVGLFALVPGGATAEGDAALAAVLADIDGRLGVQVADTLQRLGLRRLIVIADRMLNIVPWGALPSFRGFAVSVATSPSDVVEARGAAPAAARTSTLIGNPTLDLPVSEAATVAVATHLDAGGYAVAALIGVDATATHVRQAIGAATILHVAGHGRGELGHAALELNAAELRPGTADPFPAWMADVWHWEHSDEDDGDGEIDGWRERSARVDGLGRLSERRYEGGADIVRFAETDTGTLAASYAGGRLQRISHLLTDREILTAGRGDVRLAVLSACESGVGIGRPDDKELGLARAFRLAGVRSVIATLWPVEEATAVVFNDLLYAELAVRGGRIDLAGLVHDTSDRLRRMSRDEARQRLLAMSDAAVHPLARLALEAYAEGIADPPFGRRWQWATFVVVGDPDLHVEEAQP